MGGTISIQSKLFNALLHNKNNDVESILDSNPEIVNQLINKEKTFTPIMAAAYYNSTYCIKHILARNPDMLIMEKNRNAYFLAAERDNDTILKAMWSHSEFKEENEEGINVLDWAILKMSYKSAFFLKNEIGMTIKELDFYLTEKNKDSLYNIPLFIECLENKVERNATPSFYLSKKQKKDLEGHLPDPKETWPAFYRRMLNFGLYHPPLVKVDEVSEEDKKTIYMKTQTKLLELMYNKKCKVFLKSVPINTSIKEGEKIEMKVENDEKVKSEDVLNDES